MTLWIIGCSGSKREGTQVAAMKYDSRQHRLLFQHFWTERYACGDQLAILSAEFGLIDVMTSIPNYDRRMDAKRAAEFEVSSEQAAKMASMLDGHDQVLIFGGRLYRDVVKALVAKVSDKIEVVEIVGENRGIGDHFSELVALLEDGDE